MLLISDLQLHGKYLTVTGYLPVDTFSSVCQTPTTLSTPRLWVFELTCHPVQQYSLLFTSSCSCSVSYYDSVIYVVYCTAVWWERKTILYVCPSEKILTWKCGFSFVSIAWMELALNRDINCALQGNDAILRCWEKSLKRSMFLCQVGYSITLMY